MIWVGGAGDGGTWPAGGKLSQVELLLTPPCCIYTAQVNEASPDLFRPAINTLSLHCTFYTQCTILVRRRYTFTQTCAFPLKPVVGYETAQNFASAQANRVTKSMLEG